MSSRSILMSTPGPPHDAHPPESLAQLLDWLRHHPAVSDAGRLALVDAVARVFARQERLWQQSKDEALQAMSVGFGDRMRRMREELAARETTVASITRYFEALVADLTDRADRDPKTQLMNFQRFIEQLEAFLALEQRGTWCAVGLVDIRAFKQYNDVFGHAVGDRVINRVARLLREHIRSHDLVAQEPGHDGRSELHARFGGDEFCFFVPRLDGALDAWVIAERFRDAVNRFDWSLEDERVMARAVEVDVGVACLRLGSIEARRPLAARLTQELLAHADRAMYEAKSQRSARVCTVALQVTRDGLAPVAGSG